MICMSLFNCINSIWKKIEEATGENAVGEILEGIEESADACGFGKILNTLSRDERYKSILGLDLNEIIKIHVDWHVVFTQFKNAYKAGSFDEMRVYQAEVVRISIMLSQRMHSAIEDTLNDGHALLNSGVESIRNMTSLFKGKNAFDDFDSMLKRCCGTPSITFIGQWMISKSATLP